MNNLKKIKTGGKVLVGVFAGL